MRALLIKDILIQKRWLPLYGLYSIIFFLMFGLLSDPPDITLVLVLSSVAVGYMILLASFKADRNDTQRFMLSLPVLRTEAVHEKYLLLLLGTLYGFLCTYLLSVIFRLFGDSFVTGQPDGIDALRIISGMLLFSFLLPLYFRFGQLAVRYFIFVLVALGVVLQVVLLIVVATSSGGPNLIDSVIAWYTVRPVLQRNLILAGSGIVIGSLSYLFSYRIFIRKDI